MAETSISELTSDEQLREAYPVLSQLRPVGEDAFPELVDRMREESNYRLFALREGDEIRGLAGVEVRTNLYHGKHAWIHDLVVDEPHRGDGFGGQLLAWVEAWADERECTCVELASGLWRDEAHDFYEGRGMERYCYTFKADLSTEAPY